MVAGGGARWRRCSAFPHEGWTEGLFIGEVHRALKQGGTEGAAMGSSRAAHGQRGQAGCAHVPGRDTRRRGFPRRSACVPASGGAASGSAARLGAWAGGTAYGATRACLALWPARRHGVASTISTGPVRKQTTPNF
jgi:hypothetical protein